jgi:predicted AlkP superfamily phosphohydrolase/phosphomutase
VNRPRITLSSIVGICAVLALLAGGSCRRDNETHPRVVIIGMDGLDPRRCERLMDEGLLPNLARLRAQGGYRRLGTSVPPQSPVAWSNFITGAGPGVHGIFDFIHRDPAKQYAPYYSAAKTVESEDGWEVGDHKLPLTFWPFNHNPTQTLLKRHGTPFWEYLDRAGIPVHIYDIPANYPPTPSTHGHVCCLSGMGVPDLLGSYGTYQFFHEKWDGADDGHPRPEPGGGGIHQEISFDHNAARTHLTGPTNTAATQPEPLKVEFTIHRDPDQNAARVDFQGQTIVLLEGEWSDWCKVSYEVPMPSFLPKGTVGGIVRFYLQKTHAPFRLYVTPVNIDPTDPGEQRVTEPPEFLREIAEALGLFYTAGFQEDHNALSNRVFNDAEYQQQAHYVIEERMNLLEYATGSYDDGLLFFYFSGTDLQAHMFWWDGDEPHPVRSKEMARRFDDVITDLYRLMDRTVGDILQRYGDSATVMVMSDHGFSNFKRQINLNTWLRDEGFINPPDCESLLFDPARPDRKLVDWISTRAYGLGLNGLYLNMWGRERDGVVDPDQRDAVIEDITKRLLALRDPKTGEPIVARVYRTDEIYAGPEAKNAPDLIVGYHRGYRASWATVLGRMTEQIVSDNDKAWSADHCMAAEEVPGVLFCNRPIPRDDPDLTDLAPTVLKLFGVPVPEAMTGTSVLERKLATAAGISKE